MTTLSPTTVSAESPRLFQTELLFAQHLVQGIGYFLMTPLFHLALGKMSDPATINHNPALENAMTEFPETILGRLLNIAGQALH